MILEDRHGLHQIGSLCIQTAGRSGHFFDQGSVLLRRLVHLRHGFTHLGNALALLTAGSADLSHDVRDPADRRHDLGHGGPRLIDLRTALLHPFNAGRDQALDLLGGLGTAAGQAAHLAGHHGEAPPLLAGAGRCSR